MTGLFLANVLLALTWGLVTGSFSALNLAFGFVVGAVALVIIREQTGSVGYVTRAWKVTRLIWLFLYELVLSGLRVARIVLTPGKMPLKPALIGFPLAVTRDFEITMLANLITLTPGTLSVDVSDDRRTLYIHALDGADPEAIRRDIAEGFEAQILEAFR